MDSGDTGGAPGLLRSPSGELEFSDEIVGGADGAARLHAFRAHSGGEKAGEVFVRTDPGAGHSRVQNLFVRPSMRGQGVGRSLMERAIGAYGEGRELRLGAAPYHVVDGAPGAPDLAGFYGSMGFATFDDTGEMVRPASMGKAASMLRGPDPGDVAELSGSVSALVAAWDKGAGGPGEVDERPGLVLARLAEMEIDPEISLRTLDSDYSALGTKPLLATSAKLLAVNRGEVDPDDRDHKANQTYHSVDDFMEERVMKDAGGVARGLLARSAYNGSLKALKPGHFTPQLEGLIVGNSLSQAVPGINPVELLDTGQKITQLGEGGIPSRDAIPMSAREVHTSHLGFIDPVRTPESGMVGVDQRLGSYVMKGPDNQIYMPVVSRLTGKRVWRTPSQLYSSSIRFPSRVPIPPRQKSAGHEMEKGVPAVVGSSIDLVGPGSGDYDLVSPNQMFSDASNMIPMSQSMKGARALISAKYFTQALPMREQEAPLVDALDERDGNPFGRSIGDRVGVRRSGVDGEVVSVGRGRITVRDGAGKLHRKEIYDHFPHAKKTYTHDRPLVKAGDRVRAGQPLARSNYVTDDGDLALGRNLRVAFMAAPGGSSFEDSIAVSQSAAEKLTSTHLYGFSADAREGTETTKKRFVSLFPNRYTREQLDKVGDDGMAKPGASLEPGDPVMLGVRPRVLSSRDAALGSLSKVLKNSFEDASQEWDKPRGGTVTDAVSTRGKFRVNVATEMPLRSGDKLSARQGAKGVVGKVIPDGRMPHDAEGNPVDIFINPAALIGRVNPSMVYEALLGKVAQKTGNRYVLPSFSEGSVRDYVAAELRKAGVPDTESLTDPTTGRSVEGVLTGNQYFMKLEHTSEDKISGRHEGGVDVNEQPSKGGKEGAKRLGGLMDTALLGSNATEVLRDKQVYRGTKNADMWRAIRSGRPLPKAEVPFIYNKYLNTLRAAGVRVDEQPDRVSVTAMTDRDVDDLAPLEVKSGDTIDSRTGDPIRGGLFDYSLFGGPEQKGWGVITLKEPIPNPIMEDQLRAVLGLTKPALRDVMAGRKDLGGKSGPGALMGALRGADLDGLEGAAVNTIRLGRGSKRNDAIRRLRAIRGLKAAGLDATDLMITRVPVLPPAYRPAVKMGDMTLVADANYLYKDLLGARDTLEANRKTLPDSELQEERLAVYDAVKAVQGMGDPIHRETRDKGVKGFVQALTGAGKGPKCYDDETEVLTEDGWVPFPDYNDPSVKVGTFNPESGELEFQSPSEVLHEHYEGPMVRTETSKLDLLVTEGHWHYVERCKKPNPGDGSRQRAFTKATKVQAADLADHPSWRVRYTTAADNFRGETPAYEFGGQGVDPDAFAEFVGWWVAEGWHGTGGHNTYLAQKAGTVDTDLIDDMMSRLGLEHSRTVYKKGTKSEFHEVGYETVYWSIANKELVGWLTEHCGSGAGNKKLSPEILSWAKEHQLRLVRAYLEGDGERRKSKKRAGRTYFNMSEAIDNRSRFSTTSRDLVRAIERLCLQCGLGFRVTDELHGDHPIWNTMWRCRVYGWNRVVVEGKKLTRRIPDWSGMVHCVTVPNGLIFVRRNGRTVVSGNTGMFQSKVLGHPVNTVGRSVIIPDSRLDMDHVGIPEKMAWNMYEPFVMGRMVRGGMQQAQAARELEKHSPIARKFLLEEMGARPVLYSRDPALHKFSIMGANPVLVPGDSIRISPLVVGPFNADFDGDAMNVHLPVSPGAVKEVREKLMPSQNLFSARARKVHYTPSQEFILGLYNATRPAAGKKRQRFRTKADAIRAYEEQKIDLDTPVVIG